MKELGPAEFSAATGLSVKALRLYDERGLLVPARVDRATGYRRYTEDQIAIAGRIALLRRAGIGLADIERFLAERPSSGRNTHLPGRRRRSGLLCPARLPDDAAPAVGL